MITLALRDDFWVAYDVKRASLYKVWRDGVDFDGPVYTTAHGAQPTSIGNAYLVSPFDEPWSVVTDGGEIKPEVEFRGHRFEDGGVILRYDLVLPNGIVVTINERPEYAGEGEGRPGFERVFTTSNVPQGAPVVLETHLHSLRSVNSYRTDGRFEAGPVSEMALAGGNAYTLDGRLLLNSNGATRMTSWFTREPVVVMESGEGSDEEKDPGLVLIENSDCHACHNTELQTIGPSYRAIAQRYDSTSENVSMLAQKIIDGGAGSWADEVGTALMTPHPDMHPDDAMKMAGYILGLDADTALAQVGRSDPLTDKGTPYPLTQDVRGDGHGLVVNVYRFPGPLQEMPEPGPDDLPIYSGVVPGLHIPEESGFGELEEYFYVTATGQIEIPETTNYVFRLISDDGSVLYIDGTEIIDHGGEHGATVMDGEVFLEAGTYPIRVEYFQGGGGKALSLQWIRHGEDEFTVIGPDALTYDEADVQETRPYEPPGEEEPVNAGDQEPLVDVHPAFRLETVRPPTFEPKVSGMDFLPDGRLILSTWDPDGTVYVISNLNAENPEDVSVEPIAKGLLEPLGVKIVDGDIYVLQKHELTQLIDHDGDGVTDEFRTVSDDWGATSNFHEFSFGLEYRDGYFYAALATAILPGGASAPDQNSDRGKVIRISRADGSVQPVASGLRTPNGLAFGVDGELFVTDNQGDWLPSSKLLHIVEGRFYGNRSVEPETSETLQEAPPVVWLPQNEIGNSPSQPTLLNLGPYENQMIHGDVTHGGLKRVFVEKVDGEYQGAVFRFTQGLEAGVNRIVWGPDGKLYVGGIGNPGNWSHYGKNWFGLQRLSYVGEPPFEMLAVRAREEGLEIEFTEPADTAAAAKPENYEIRQWWYEPTPAYGGPMKDEEVLDVTAVQLSDDRRRAFLEIDGIEERHVVYVHLRKPFKSARGGELWSTEAWYTMNRIPTEAVATAEP